MDNPALEFAMVNQKELFRNAPIVIMLTNHPYPQYREKCQVLGADYFFDKVTEIEKIYDTYSILNLAADTECHQTWTIIALVNLGHGG